MKSNQEVVGRRTITAAIGPYHIKKTNILINNVKTPFVKLISLGEVVLYCPYTHKAINYHGVQSHFYSKNGECRVEIVTPYLYDGLCTQLRSVLNTVQGQGQLVPRTLAHSVWQNNSTYTLDPKHATSYAHLMLAMLYELDELKKVVTKLNAKVGVAYVQFSNIWNIGPPSLQPEYLFLQTEDAFTMRDLAIQIAQHRTKSIWPIGLCRQIKGDDIHALSFDTYIDCVLQAQLLTKYLKQGAM